MDVQRTIVDTERRAALEAVEHAFTVLVRRSSLPRMHERLGAVTGIPVEPGGYLLLKRVGQWEPVRLSDIADRIGLDASTVSRQVATLERAGLLVRRADPEDGRAWRVLLSPEGKRILMRLRRERRRKLDDALRGWSVEDIARLGDLLRRFAEALDTIT